MGKVRKVRQKLHQKAVRFTDEEQDKDPLKANEVKSPKFKNSHATSLNIREEMMIQSTALHTSLVKSSLPSIFPTSGLFNDKETAKDVSTTKNISVSKKDKRKERHERFLKKLHGTRAVEESIKKAEKRAKTVIVGDMEPLLSALPTIPLPETSNEKSVHQGNSRKKNKFSRSIRKKLQIADIEHFKQVLKHPSYQSNPIGTISEHLKIAIQREVGPTT